MGAHRITRCITAACEECGRATGDRSVTTEDGYTFQRQQDGSWTDGDMTFGSLDEIKSQVGIIRLGPGEPECSGSSDQALCSECWQEELFRRQDIRPQAAATKAIDRIGVRLLAAIKREATWQSALRENYDNDFGQWLEYSDMYGLAARLGFATAEEAWEANPTIQGSTNPTDFKVVPEDEQMDMELSASLGWTCESCGSNMRPDEPCDCGRRAEARQPELTRATRVARESFDIMPPRITNAAKVARRIATAGVYFVGEVFMPDMRTDPRNEGRMGSVVIGGDRGDVWATSAYASERHGVDGVILTDVEFRTTLNLDDLAADDLLDEVMQVISEGYDSIQEDAFAPKTK